jgi:alkylhydroperoxidase family enzyme
MSERDVQELRDHGWSDPAIHDATQVIAYFNYINRIADGLGVDLETDIRKWEEG